jgi:hypothetical protein
VFECGSLDGILDSSVLHHVTTFSGYDRSAPTLLRDGHLRIAAERSAHAVLRR